MSVSTASNPQTPNDDPTAVSPVRVAGALTFFCMSSLGAIFVNKMMLTHYRFSYPSAIMLLQSIFTLCLIPAVEALRPSLVRVTPLMRGEWRKLVVPAFCFVANVTVGLGALSRVNIPMFSAFRRLTVLFVMGAEWIFLRRTHSRRVVLSVCVLTSGAFVSALGDVTFSTLGYALVFANNALTACYLAAIKRAMKGENALDPISLLFHLNTLACPAIALLAVASGDLRQAIVAYHVRADLRESLFFLPVLGIVSCSAFLVNLSTSVCTHVTSPLTTSVAGQVKNVAQSILGFFSWGYEPTLLNVFGLLVALTGQVAFARFKFEESNNSKSADNDKSRDGLLSPDKESR